MTAHLLLTGHFLWGDRTSGVCWTVCQAPSHMRFPSQNRQTDFTSLRSTEPLGLYVLDKKPENESQYSNPVFFDANLETFNDTLSFPSSGNFYLSLTNKGHLQAYVIVQAWWVK